MTTKGHSVRTRKDDVDFGESRGTGVTGILDMEGLFSMTLWGVNIGVDVLGVCAAEGGVLAGVLIALAGVVDTAGVDVSGVDLAGDIAGDWSDVVACVGVSVDVAGLVGVLV